MSLSMIKYQQTLKGGCWIAVVDLASLHLRSNTCEGNRRAREWDLRKVVECVERNGLQFLSDGCGVVVVPRDAQVVQVS